MFRGREEREKKESISSVVISLIILPRPQKETKQGIKMMKSI